MDNANLNGRSNKMQWHWHWILERLTYVVGGLIEKMQTQNIAAEGTRSWVRRPSKGWMQEAENCFELQECNHSLRLNSGTSAVTN
jgi:hypothetical protein